MRPRRQSKAGRVLRWQHAALGVLLLSSLLYAGLIVSWTLQSPETVQRGPGVNVFQRGKQALEAETRRAHAHHVRVDGLAEVTASSRASATPGDNLLRVSGQQSLVEPSSTRRKKLFSGSAPHDAVVKLPSNSSQVRRFKCLGWRATAECSPNGSRLPQNDQDCNSTIPDGTSGYCEVEDLDSNERFMVMKRTCAKGYQGTVFRCSDAPGFANFRAKAQQVTDKTLLPGYALPNMNSSASLARQGIVMVVYPKLVASMYATVRTLREVLKCNLPIEVWLRPNEMNKAPGALKPLRDLARNTSAGEITFEAIRHPQAFQFNSKVYAIYHSKFQQVLFLDADNVPVKDPSYLFQTHEFVKAGAVFWPDFWHPGQTIFAINQTSLVWQLLDMPFVDMFEQESGQLLVDRKRHAAPLALVAFYAFHLPNYFNRLKLAWGDKDLFRFAWLRLGAAFHMIDTLPAVAGEVTGQWFCGMTMAQHDPSGDVIFLHRNQLKLTGDSKLQNFDPRLKNVFGSIQPAVEDDGYPDPAIWTHLVSFRENSPRSEYTIQKHAAMNRFTGLQRCFGGRELHTNPHFYTQEFADLSFAGLESHLREFAMTGAQLQQIKVV
ncbi:hypothetical protein PHYPSEUDO_005798 [Phytophthora pseudosyringae]|uniref:Nucleotide-diphospho-sugar transferase n=1 Tax=Phytophthora pseudosyringae TaxID=221518 RepID=A0A8T1VNJ3_9STRA|nr:hypothetical protein PHYPSEUDO_005798 [Phytophthora pseudosyringae]